MTELLFLTHNRREFADASFLAMLANTDWSLVSKLWLFDDRSVDGTQDLVHKAAYLSPVEAEVVHGEWNSPVVAMADFFTRANSDLVVKIDSDTMLPPLWLNDCETVMREYPDVNILGIEARGESSDDSAPSGAVRRPDPTDWIGGIGVMRRSIFRDRLPDCTVPADSPNREARKYFGWQHWQIRHKEIVRAAWIKPSLQVFLLDRMPSEPWRSLSDRYVARGWQRKEPYLYGPEWSALWSWHKEAVCA